MYGKEELLQVVEERQEKLQLEIQLHGEICNKMVEQMQQQEQWCSEHLDTQKELSEELLHQEKLKILKESLTTSYHEQIQERDEKTEELETLLQEAKQQPVAQQSGGYELSLCRSQRLAASASAQQFQEVKTRAMQTELSSRTEELQKYQQLLKPPPAVKPFTTDVDKKLEEG